MPKPHSRLTKVISAPASAISPALPQMQNQKLTGSLSESSASAYHPLFSGVKAAGVIPQHGLMPLLKTPPIRTTLPGTSLTLTSPLLLITVSSFEHSIALVTTPRLTTTSKPFSLQQQAPSGNRPGWQCAVVQLQDMPFRRAYFSKGVVAKGSQAIQHCACQLHAPMTMLEPRNIRTEQFSRRTVE